MICSPVQNFCSLGACIEIEPLHGSARTRVLTIGRLKYEKNQRLLIEAMAKPPRELEAKMMVLGKSLSGPSSPQPPNALGSART